MSLKEPISLTPHRYLAHEPLWILCRVVQQTELDQRCLQWRCAYPGSSIPCSYCVSADSEAIHANKTPFIILIGDKNPVLVDIILPRSFHRHIIVIHVINDTLLSTILKVF